MSWDVVDLSSAATTEQIARFNRRFIPELRLSDQWFLKWKYRTSTPDGVAITAHHGIVDSDEIIAEISLQPMRAWVDGEWQPCNYWGDWFADPDHKGAGFYLLNHIMARNTSLLACGPSEQAGKIYTLMKFLVAPIDQRFIFFPRPIGSLLATRSFPRQAAGLFLKWSKRPFSRIPASTLEGDLQISEAKSVDSDLLENWELDAPKNTIFVRRESWMFSWFLDEFPFSEFRLMVLSSAGVQVGYVLLHLRRKFNGLMEGKIVDLFARGWNYNHLIALFREGARQLIKLGAHTVNYHATHPLFISLAVDSGFTKTFDESVIMNGPIAEAIGSGRSNLHVTYYDYDGAYY